MSMACSLPFRQPLSVGQPLGQPMGLGAIVNRNRGGSMNPPHPRKKQSKTPHFLLAHFNQRELDGLSQLQGKEIRDPKTGLQEINLDHIFQNYPMMDHLKNHLAQRRASGGSLHAMAEKGIHGDNRMGYISRPTSEALDYLMGGPSLNPHTGHKEYFGLSDIWDGIKNVGSTLWDAGKHVVGTALPALGTAAGAAFGGPVGSALGGALGTGLGGWLGNDDHGSSQQQPQNESQGRMPQQQQQPSSHSQTGQGLGQIVSQLGKAALNQYGGQLPSYLQQGLHSGLNMMGGADPHQELAQYGRTMVNQYGGQLPYYAREGLNTGFNMMGGADPRQELSQYGGALMNQYAPSGMGYGHQGGYGSGYGAGYGSQEGYHQGAHGMSPSMRPYGYGQPYPRMNAEQFAQGYGY